MSYTAQLQPGPCPIARRPIPARLHAFSPHGAAGLHARVAASPGLGRRRHTQRIQERKQPVVVAAIAATADAFQPSPIDTSSLRKRLQAAFSTTHDREIWAVALPALVAMLLEPVMNALNAGLVGHLGTQQLSAVSLGSLSVSFCTFLFSFLLFLTVPEIAAAVVKKDHDAVSSIAAKSLWIAAVCGFTSATALFLMAGAIVGALNPPEAAVAAYAIDYIKVRALGIPAVLLGFVATGVFRGFKDTKTPLFGAVVSAGASLGLNGLFLYVLKMGVVGSAVATTAAQILSSVLLMAALLRGGKIQARHLTSPPSLAVVLPTLKLGAVLGARNVISFGMVLYASTMCIRMGSTYQASFEVIRQVWILTIQFFECLNVAAQALCASYLGNEDRATARSILARLVVLGTGMGVLVGVVVWLAHQPLVGFFTRDPAVVAQVMATLPLICLLFPVDAAASIMDGSLLAAKQSNYMSAVQVAGSAVQYCVLAYLASTGNVTTVGVWSALKILSCARLIGGGWRSYFSPKSAYLPLPIALVSPAAAPATHLQPAVAAAAAVSIAATAAATTAPPLIRAGAAASHEQPTVLEPSVALAAATSTALQSFEEDVMVLACAACNSATDMHPDMLPLHRRAVEAAADHDGGGSSSGNSSGNSSGSTNGSTNGGNGSGNGSGSSTTGGGGGNGVAVNIHISGMNGSGGGAVEMAADPVSLVASAPAVDPAGRG